MCVCAHLNLQLPELSKSSKYPPIHGTSTSSAGRLFSKVATCPATSGKAQRVSPVESQNTMENHGKSVNIVSKSELNGGLWPGK